MKSLRKFHFSGCLTILFLSFFSTLNAQTTPVANAGIDQTCLVNEPCFLDATGSTPYKDIYDYEWDFDAADGVHFRDSIGAFCFKKYTSVGVYTTTVRVKDKNGATNTDTVTVTVVNPTMNAAYYVAKSGSDANNGSEESPWLTVGKAVTTATSGDTVIVKAGTYQERLSFTRSGTVTAPITFKANPGDTVILRATGSGDQIFFSCDYVAIDGFDIDGNRTAGHCISAYDGAHHISVKNCKIHDTNWEAASPNWNWGVHIGSGHDADYKTAAKTYFVFYNCEISNNSERNILIGSSHNLIEKCDIHHPLGPGQRDNISFAHAGMGNILYNSKVHHNDTIDPAQAHCDLIEIYGADNILIENNELFNSSSEGIMADAAVNPAVDVNRNVVFIRNRVWYEGVRIKYYELILYDCPNIKIFNNVFNNIVYGINWRPNKGPELTWGQIRNNIAHTCNRMFVADGGGTHIHSNNIYYNSGTLADNSDSAANNSQIVDPKFLNHTVHDYHLQASSPAIDAGIFTGLSYLGGAPDIGAFEYIPSATQTVNLTPGWNWISFNVTRSDLSLNSVFASILGQVEQVKTQTQSAIRSGNIWKGDLADMSGIGQYKMYKVKVTQACTLTVSGSAIAQTTSIPLHVGWNWVAYLPTTNMPIATALASINGQVLEVKSLTKSATYSGGAWSGTLTILNPGQGYAIKMNGPGTLTYPAATGN